MSETVRIPCKLCGAMILPATAKTTGGICMLCHRTAQDAALRKKKKIRSDCLFSVPSQLTHSKSLDYRKSTFLIALACAEAFTESKITTTDLVSRYESDSEGFHIYLSDFTDEGKAIVVEVFEKWYRNMGRWKTNDVPELQIFKTSLMGQIERCRNKNAQQEKYT